MIPAYRLSPWMSGDASVLIRSAKGTVAESADSIAAVITHFGHIEDEDFRALLHAAMKSLMGLEEYLTELLHAARQQARSS
ncbi:MULTISPECIES: hypothetical protein [Protofrankia]|uniref:Uncharacterized protein n=1 Tax=Candidatus Protofrankia datiscae TaxID=2716812 RepID=F8B4G0_9ACTN|nr:MULTISPECIES: hypothetical protein [Protofrankia]AEH07901.1 hypothetical protein FsymDg_0333 [Candidatus Protofrankia datiscae]